MPVLSSTSQARASGRDAAAPLGMDPFEGSPYRAVRRLASGGMSELFLVEHRQLGRECVAKVLHEHLASNPLIVDRMRIEAQSLGRLRHPHIVSVLGFCATRDGRHALVMEALRGRTLKAELGERGVLPLPEALDTMRQLLSALSAAHAQGIVHRDLKPENVFICDDPHRGRVLKVLDFGIARVVPEAPAGAPAPLVVPTDTGVVVGTPRFVSPEAARGERVDHRADIYGAGLLLYQMLTGRGPFDHLEGHGSIIAAHAAMQPEPPSRFARVPLPSDVDEAVLTALAKRREDRFQSAAAFAACLLAVRAALAAPSGRAAPAIGPARQSAARDASAVDVPPLQRNAQAPGQPAGRARRLLAAVTVMLIAVLAAGVGVAAVSMLRWILEGR